ncbi:MAG: CbtB-domain containing protein [Deltaproteobacteria bacterium]|nr:CbtB-domain containing protein [Deltaproteobacteria bacterium]MBI5454046.1 CbtB-domain containing protein [Deltaproteobacteria bacterium]
MERILGRENTGWMLIGAAALVLIACAMVVVAFGMESVAPGVHDAFHDFRHVIGMPCH